MSDILQELLNGYFMSRQPSAGGTDEPILDAKPTLTCEIKTGLCIVRTQGKRLELLEECLQSILGQSLPITPCVIVHGEEYLFEEMKEWLKSNTIEAITLHAGRTDRNRGHPMNVGLDFLRHHYNAFDFFFFLDDDDILYPFYAERLVSALALSGAEIAFGLSNQRVPWNPPEQGHRAFPVSCLVAGNFIPIHCYIVRTQTLIRTGVRAREDMDYLEDWDFLLSLLASGARFHHLPEIICEYRIIGDGNRLIRRDQIHYDECYERVRARAMLAARKLKPDRFFEDLANVNHLERDAFSKGQIDHIMNALRFFDEAGKPFDE